MGGDTPPEGFEKSCELRANGATAREVFDLLERKYRTSKYRAGWKVRPAEVELVPEGHRQRVFADRKSEPARTGLNLAKPKISARVAAVASAKTTPWTSARPGSGLKKFVIRDYP
jgi:hypothetical protein